MSSLKILAYFILLVVFLMSIYAFYNNSRVIVLVTFLLLWLKYHNQGGLLKHLIELLED